MKLVIHPEYRFLEPFLRDLPHHFKYGGRVLHAGRNTIKLFEVKGLKLVVKSYGRPHLLNRWVYLHLRAGKAKRAFLHAERLRGLGIETPHEVAFMECSKRGLLTESYFVSLYSDGISFAEAVGAFPDPEARKIIDSFVPFAAELHAKGVLHEDLNADNVRYRLAASGYRFELIDTNRMRFVKKTSDRACMINLRRLTHNAPPYLYFIERYARLTGRDPNQTLLQGTILLLSFTRRVRRKERIKMKTGRGDKHLRH